MRAERHDDRPGRPRTKRWARGVWFAPHVTPAYRERVERIAEELVRQHQRGMTA